MVRVLLLSEAQLPAPGMGRKHLLQAAAPTRRVRGRNDAMGKVMPLASVLRLAWYFRETWEPFLSGLLAQSWAAPLASPQAMLRRACCHLDARCYYLHLAPCSCCVMACALLLPGDSRASPFLPSAGPPPLVRASPSCVWSVPP